jgi:salicylate hydroxylase
MSTPGKKFIVVGGGIGGLAAAVALSQQGVHVTVLEQAAQLGEIGAGVQLGPNAFAALDALGVGETARKRAVFTERLIMMDAVDGSEVGSFPVGQAFRDRLKNPYAVIHRADIHTSML